MDVKLQTFESIYLIIEEAVHADRPALARWYVRHVFKTLPEYGWLLAWASDNGFPPIKAVLKYATK